MQRAKPYYKKLFVFLDDINELIKINILKQHNICLLYTSDAADE